MLDCLDKGRFDLVKELCDIEIEHRKIGNLSEELYKKRIIISEKLRNK